MQSKLTITISEDIKYYTDEEAKRRINQSERCYHCDRLIKVYKYNFIRSMATALAILYKYLKNNANTDQWIHLNKFFDKYPLTKVRHWEYLQYWGLIIPSPERASDGNPSGLGEYKITKKAEEFLKCQTKIPKFCLHFHRRVIGYSDINISIDEAYDSPFDFEKFMNGTE